MPGSDLRSVRLPLVARAVVVLAGLVAVLLDAPTPVVGALVALGLLASLERLARTRTHGAADVLLVLVGGTLSALVLTGLVLGATPIGLSETSWAVGLSAVALLALIVACFLPAPAPLPRAFWVTGAKALPWVAGVAAVVAVAVTVSVHSIGPAERPPLQMSFGTVDKNQVEIVVSSSVRTGPLELRTTHAGDEVSYPLFTVRGGTTYRTTVALPRRGRYVVSVNYPDQAQPLRSLVLDR